MTTGPASGPIRPQPGPGRVLDVTPASAGWKNVAFSVVELTPSHPWSGQEADRETAIVPLSGAGRVQAGDIDTTISRTSVFEELGRVVYLPPDTPFALSTEDSLVAAVGSAPAEGRHPARVIEPDEMRVEIRGGGQAYRQVVHTLAHPLPAERLILYEVFVPRGTWSGWPPHCHDGRDGSPYLEEVYYFRLDRPEGYAVHRNWRTEEGFDEAVVAHDGDVVLVPKGYHTSTACPSANMYFLNYLAGELYDDERRTPPCFAAEHTWIEADWSAGAWQLPVAGATPSP
ncbi:5-deoxy-glucuronate isomerase [Candidatus Poriferisocius sp.]|uniref:5-deoxy-glucuronate isomerase n=1 Tax=Candidatus Poriferisocius sp. TaxID=3101276 RepID=UPI003B597380